MSIFLAAFERHSPEQGKLIRIPACVISNVTNLNRERNKFYQENGCEPTPRELLKLTGVQLGKVNEMKNLTQEPLSLEMCIDNDRDTKLADFISDESYDADPSYACCMKKFLYHNNKMMSVLNERERLILNMWYGFDEKKSIFAEIGYSPVSSSITAPV